MLGICHRINSIHELKKIPNHFGVEIDVRDYDNDLILAHDPWTHGESLEDYLKVYDHAILIVNIKCEGIELKVLDLLKKYKIRDYFFLDCTYPAIIKLINEGESSIALRLSEYESIESILTLKDKIKWVWVDCFTRPGLKLTEIKKIKEMNICIVSPDLHGNTSLIVDHLEFYSKLSIKNLAVCAKKNNLELWLK